MDLQSPVCSPDHHDSGFALSSVPSSTFQLLSGFAFDATSPDEDLSDMQEDLSSLHTFQGHHSTLQSMRGNGNNSGVQDQFHDCFPDHFIFPSDVPPDSAAWAPGNASVNLSPHSMQADILASHSESVSQLFGQITPPDDSALKKSFTMPPESMRYTPPDLSALNAKSERARNAANQRHAKAKKARQDGVRKAGSPGEEAGEENENKRERYREKNRLAAAKCRAKKKVNTEDLEQSAREVTATNTKLKAEERELRDLFSSLRDQALAHDSSQGCNCQAIHSYNNHKAQETARGVMSGFGMPSPPQPGNEPLSPDLASTHAQSFSGARPRFAGHPGSSRSVADSMGFLPSPIDGDCVESDFSPMNEDHRQLHMQMEY